MNAKEAMKIGREVMEQMNFRFDMLILNDDDERTGLVALDECNMLHLNVPLHNALGIVQTAITFEDNYVDVRTFPDPILVDVNDRDQCLRIIESLNIINAYIKMGRYYLDIDSGDIALWTRIQYWALEKLPETLTEAVITQYEYYEDLGETIMGCVNGTISVLEARSLIAEKWNE